MPRGAAFQGPAGLHTGPRIAKGRTGVQSHRAVPGREEESQVGQNVGSVTDTRLEAVARAGQRDMGGRASSKVLCRYQGWDHYSPKRTWQRKGGPGSPDGGLQAVAGPKWAKGVHGLLLGGGGWRRDNGNIFGKDPSPLGHGTGTPPAWGTPK